MNAKEAREKALDITGAKEKEQYSAIKTVISIAVDNGELSVHTYTPLLASVRRKLEKEGYTVNSYYDQRDGTTNTISW
jgi:hypothetical protein